MKRIVLLTLALVAGPAGVIGRNEMAELARRGQGASVGLSCRGPGGRYFGTGTIIRSDGVILTSSTVLPPGEQRQLNQTLQDALAKNKDGQASFWKSPSGPVSAMLVPFRSFKDPKGTSCREYRSIYSVNGRVAQHTREVCRQPDGQWQRVD